MTVLAGLLVGLAPSRTARAADAVELVFRNPGVEETFDVPAGVTEITVIAIGARGGRGGGNALATQAFGQRIYAELTVASGTRIFVNVGGNGLSGTAGGTAGEGGPNGGAVGAVGALGAGGGGGGASDIRTVGGTSLASLESRLIIAGGGGGAGGGSDGGAGGSDTPGASGGDAGGGGAGSSTAGGTGGSSASGPGAPGTLGVGGDGGSHFSTSGGGGGGGGGGHYGGGGGGNGTNAGGGGGGGGSGYTGSATFSTVGTDTIGTAEIRIFYEPAGGQSTPAPEPSTSTGPGTGVVDAEVTVPTSAACIELSTTSVSFGTQRFGGENLEATPRITVTNCSGSNENLLARGTDATGGSATWNLVDGAGSCSAGTLAINDYHLKLRREDSGESIQLSEDNRVVLGIAAGADQRVDALLDMPCPGSSGSGETMGMQIVFVVTE